MTLRARTLVLINLMLAGAVLVTTAVLTWNSYQTMLEGQMDSGEVLARIIARTASIVQSFPTEMENAIADQMVTEATITAHFVDAAEQAGWSPDEINDHLKQIVANTSLSEFWITDEKGHAYLHNMPSDFTFSPDPAKNPQAYQFYDLILGTKKVVIQSAQPRDLDKKIFKYVGVAGIDKPRIVQVGYQADVLQNLRERVSLDRLAQQLVATGDIRAIRVVGQGVKTQVFQAGIGVTNDLTPNDVRMLTLAMQTNQEQAYLDGNFLKVVEPVDDLNDPTQVTSVVVVYLPTDRLQAALRWQVEQAAIIAAIILLIGSITSLLLARAVTRPIVSLIRAASTVQAGIYDRSLLQAVTAREDELGALGRTFDQMAVEVSARDRRLKLLRVIIPIGVALSAERDFDRLLETIVIEAQKITHADAGSLYLRTEENTLRFVIVRNDSLKVYLGGTTGNPVTFQNVPMYTEDGQPNHSHLAAYVALTGEKVFLDDAYQAAGFDLSGTRAFDAQTGYHSKSFLTMPLKDTSDSIIGILQLINAKDPETGEIVPFEQDEVLDSLTLITSAGLTAYIREEGLRQEIDKLRIEVDMVKQTSQVREIADSDYFQQLQAKAQRMRERRKKKDE